MATPSQLGRYLLLERLAVGGMAEIFKAQLASGEGFEKTLVVKRLLPHFAGDPHFVEMFRDEARLTGRLAHANIVQVFDFGREGEDWFLAMEYVPGRDLFSVLKRARSVGAPMLPAGLASYVAEQVARALAFAHTRRDDRGRNLGIIHRDVTPSNILLSWEGDVKVTDFGIAKAASRMVRETEAGLVKGKVAYLAPEQLSEQGFDARVDVFALGACLWEMLAGRRMVQGDTEIEMLDRLQRPEPFPLPPSVQGMVPPSLERALIKAVARDPGQRYPDAASFQADLLAVVMETRGTTGQLATLMQHLFAAEITAENPVPESTATHSISTPEPSVTPSVTPSATPSVTPSVTPSSEPTQPRMVLPPESTQPRVIPVPAYPPPPPPPPARQEQTLTAPSPLPPVKDEPTATLSRSSQAVNARPVAVPLAGPRPLVMITGGLAAVAVVVVALVGSYFGGRLVGSNKAAPKIAAVTEQVVTEQAVTEQTVNPLPLESVAVSAAATPAATSTPEATPTPLATRTQLAVATVRPAPATPVPRPTATPLRPETQAALEEARSRAASGDLKSAQMKLYTARFHEPQAEILTYLLWKYTTQSSPPAEARKYAERYAEEYRSGFGGKFAPLPDHLREITVWSHATDEAAATPIHAGPTPMQVKPETQQALDEAKAKAASGDLKSAVLALFKARFREPQAEILTYTMWKYASQGSGDSASLEAVKFSGEYLSGFSGKFTPAPEHRKEILLWRVSHPAPPSTPQP